MKASVDVANNRNHILNIFIINGILHQWLPKIWMCNFNKFFYSFPNALAEELCYSIFSNNIMYITPAGNNPCSLLKEWHYFGNTIIFCSRWQSNYRFASF